MLSLRAVSHSEIGLVRKNNQDSGYTSAHLLVVADGMGGAAAGDLASAVAVDTLMRVDESATGPAILDVMSAAVDDANDRIADLIADDVSLDGMGTTVTAALFDGAELGLVHIGDSRAYLLREESLRRGTRPGILKGLSVTGGVITSAGVVLAATFTALGVIPILFLAQIAFIVAFGVLLDALVVRSLLVPALCHWIGPGIWWPSGLARRP